MGNKDFNPFAWGFLHRLILAATPESTLKRFRQQRTVNKKRKQRDRRHRKLVARQYRTMRVA